MKRTARRRLSRTVSAVAALALIAWVSAPVAAVWWLSVQTERAEIAPAETTWVPVQPHQGQLSRDASIYLDWATVPPIVAPQWSGTVTRNQLVAGAKITSGQSLLTIDGVERIGWSAAAPFYRPLQAGSSGEDVLALRSLLVARGLDPAASGFLGSRDLRAIRALAASIGVPDPGRVSAFDPSWVVFLPSSAVTVSKPEVAIGSPAPTAGQKLADLDPRLSSARIVQRVETGASNDSSAIDPATLVPLSTKDGERVMVGGQNAAVSDDRTTVNSAGLKVIEAAAQPGAPLVSANLVSASQAGLWVVPGASLLTDLSGHPCVIAKNAAGMRHVPVTIAASEGANAVVSGGLTSKDQVGLNSRIGVLACH